MQKVRLFLTVLLSLVVLPACSPAVNDSTAITKTVAAALETVVVEQMASLPTKTPTEVIIPTATPTLIPTETPVPTATTWFQTVDSVELPDTRYGLVMEAPVILYSSAEEAAVQGDRFRTLPGEEVHVSFTNVQTVDDQEYFEVEPGGWISASVIQEETPSTYAGVMITEFPENGFGWLITDVDSLAAVPEEDVTSQVAGHYSRYTLFEVLSVYEDAQRTRWFEIAPDEWVSDDDFAYVGEIQGNPTRGATNRWISVNLTEQYVMAYENNHPVYASLVSTGKIPGWTGSGVFTVYHKDEAYSLFTPDPDTVGNYFIQDVPYILYYQGSWALHGAYWHDNFGQRSSHGCVNLSLNDAEWLYNWAKVGEWVILYYE